MGERSYPFAGKPARQPEWLRMSRLWAPSHIVGDPTVNPYGLTVSGLTATVSCRPDGSSAESWVDGSMHELAYDADTQGKVSFAVPANTAANPRVDRIVLRRDPAANRVHITRLEGTPAASPVAPTLTQTPGGVYEFPLWRFTVPANNGAPLTGLVDDRYWANPDTGWQGYADPTRKVYKAVETSRASTTTLTDDPDLYFDVTAGTYSVEGYVHVGSTSTTTDARLQMAATAGVVAAASSYTMVAQPNGASSASGTAYVTTGSWVDLATSASVGTMGALATAPSGVVISGIVTLTTAARLSLRWSQNSFATSATVLGAGSWLRLQKLS